MSVTKFLSKSRGINNLLFRFISILSRFGLTSRKFDKLLRKFGAVTARLGCVPTFAITAVTLKRHPGMVRELHRQGVEFAVHGYIHTDYGVLPLEEQVKHFKRAIDTFQECRLPYTGFRAPFLRTNSETPEAISRLKFPYDSSNSISWDVIDHDEHSKESCREYERLLDFYQSKKDCDYLSLPRVHDGFVEIPVSIPDDEAMVERLGITGVKEIGTVWGAMLERAYNRGELLTLQLHPERISLCEDALVSVIRQAGQFDLPVWVTTLREITEWCQEREKFKLEILPESNGIYQVRAFCSERATLLLKNCKANVPAVPWSGGYQSIAAREFVLESPARPAIGIGWDSSPAAVGFLRSEGYIVGMSDNPDDYAIFLGDLAGFQEADEKPLSEKLEKLGGPLLRYWRWPGQARSAVSVTGDIDSITLIDFALRIWENWRQDSKH